MNNISLPTRDPQILSFHIPRSKTFAIAALSVTLGIITYVACKSLKSCFMPQAREHLEGTPPPSARELLKRANQSPEWRKHFPETPEQRTREEINRVWSDLDPSSSDPDEDIKVKKSALFKQHGKVLFPDRLNDEDCSCRN